MNKIRHWSTCLITGFDSVIGKIENHEAVVTTSIRDLQKAAAEARIKSNRLQREIASMQQRAIDLESKRERWTQRALQLRDTEKEKAIECLRRKKRAEAEVARLRSDIPEHESIARQIESDLAQFENRIAELKLKKRSFSTRASRSKAIKACESTFAEPHSENLEDVFDRWEMKLAETEVGTCRSTDNFESEFLKEEERDTLSAELDSLQQGEEKNDK